MDVSEYMYEMKHNKQQKQHKSYLYTIHTVLCTYSMVYADLYVSVQNNKQ